MVNILLLPLAKIVINLVGKETIKNIADNGLNELCDFLENRGFVKGVCRPLGKTIIKLVL